MLTPDRTKNMEQLADFLKKEGLSDAKIKQALSIASGQQEAVKDEVKEIPKAVQEALTPVQETPAPTLETPTTHQEARLNVEDTSLKNTLRSVSDAKTVGDYVLTGQNMDVNISVMNPLYSANTGRS